MALSETSSSPGTWSANDHTLYSAYDRREMLEFIDPGVKSVLDVGCCTGNFGALLKKERGAEVWGVEVDPDAAEIAGENLDRVMNSGFSGDLDIPSDYFDCVVFNDSLEHLVDPMQALNVTHRILRSGGSVVASIPNVRYYENVLAFIIKKDWKYEDSGILDKTHLRFFTRKSIERLFRETGFEVRSVVGLNDVKWALSAKIRWSFRILNAATLGSVNDMRWLQFAVVARKRQV